MCSYRIMFGSYVLKNKRTAANRVFPLSILSFEDELDDNGMVSTLLTKYPEIVSSLTMNSKDIIVSGTTIAPEESFTGEYNKYEKTLINDSISNMLIEIPESPRYFIFSSCRDWNIAAMFMGLLTDSNGFQSRSRFESTDDGRPEIKLLREIVYKNEDVFNRLNLPKRAVIDFSDDEDKLSSSEKSRINSICGLLYSNEYLGSNIYVAGTVNTPYVDIVERVQDLDPNENLVLLTLSREDRLEYNSQSLSRYPLLKIKSLGVEPGTKFEVQKLFIDDMYLSGVSCGLSTASPISYRTPEMKAITQAFKK